MEIPRKMKCMIIQFVVLAVAFAAAGDAVASVEDAMRGSALDPLSMRWTFGNHEPIAMYRRVGGRTTGGVEGSALWLEDWHRWYDAESPVVMERLGLNWIHSRFFKGLGWAEEKRDFPAVKRFVANCHAHGVKTLAYVQFASLYHEKFALEVPDIAGWAAYDANGKHLCWHDQPFRWIPCMTSVPFREYLKRMVSIALGEGGFDGVMFDNVSSVPQCYCECCRELFKIHIGKIPDFGSRFGYSDGEGLSAPTRKPKRGEVMDPIEQEWNRWQAANLTALVRELRNHVHSVKPDAVFAGNLTDLRRRDAFRALCLDVVAVAPLFDLVVGQSGNVPSVKDGFIINRVRDLKLAAALGVVDLSLCDADAGIARDDERFYFLPLLEDAIWGGVPTDRTVMTPARGKGFVDEDLLAVRKPLLDRFNSFVSENRESFAAPSCAALGLWYSTDGMKVSDVNWKGCMGAEEILLRNHIPYRLLVSQADAPAAVPEGCDTILVADQKCLSDKEIATLKTWVENGGKLVVTGSSGDSDELNRQRWRNPFAGSACREGFIYRTEQDDCAVDCGIWQYRIAPPKDGGSRLVADLAKVGLVQDVSLSSLPERVLIEMKRTSAGYAVHLLDYNPTVPVSGAMLHLPKGAKAVFKTLDGKCTEITENNCTVKLPDFTGYALVEVQELATHPQK